MLSHVRALLYGVEPETDGSDLPADTPPAVRALATTPMGLRELPDPELLAEDWVVLRPRLTGICGSDVKQVFLDGDADSPMTAVISFPQVLGHECVADVVEAGPRSGRTVGERVVLNPWLSCGPRGIDPVCPACDEGAFNLCHSFVDGRLPPGIHTGNSSTATGGFAELMPAHGSMCLPCPDDVADEVAVLADPFSVALHSVLRTPPPPGGSALVYGVGALGLSTVEILRAFHPDVRVAAVTRFPHQSKAAERHGAVALSHEPREDLVRAVADWTGGRVHVPWLGLPWLHPGGVDVVYDTVATAESLEVGVRVLRARGAMSITGVSAPARFEWSPWYFKELTLVGSNAFGIEELDGVRQHAIAHYLDLVRAGRVDVSDLLTHTFGLDEWRAAFGALAQQEKSGAMKVAFDLRESPGPAGGTVQTEARRRSAGGLEVR
jgi:threonine dehydrogenase-like Zn-dependent dehydrogenase